MDNLFSSAEIHSSNFDTELAKLTGATPDYKVFILPDSFKVDTLSEWNAGTFNNISAGTLGTFGTNGNIKNSVIGTYITGTTYSGTIEMIGAYSSDDNPQNVSPNYVVVHKHISGTTGTVIEIQTVIKTAGTIKVGVYSDIEGLPTTLIGTSLSAFTCSVGTNKIPTTNIPIVNNGTYWLAFNMSATDLIRSGTVSPVFTQYKALPFANAFPDSYGIADGTVNTWNLSIKGFGIVITGTAYGTQYATIGTYTSRIFDSKLFNNYKWLGFNEIKNAGTTLYQFRTGSTSPDCDAQTWVNFNSGTRPKIGDNEFYQFRTILSGDGTTTPVVDSVSGTYIYNPTDDPLAGLIDAGGVSRSLERLFQETSISGMSPIFSNEYGFFTPGGTGLFGTAIAKGIYNDKLEVWNGFKYGWTGSTFGTAEYIPAFTGYIDNISVNDQTGRAVISARDKGKLFKLRTSENCTTTGTAGGAYWTNERLDFAVAELLEKSCQYGSSQIDYDIMRTFLVDHNGTKTFSSMGFITDSLTDTSMDYLNGKYYFTRRAGAVMELLKYDDIGTITLIGTYDTTIEFIKMANDGTHIYMTNNAVDSNGFNYKYDNTTNILGTNPFIMECEVWNIDGTIYTGSTDFKLHKIINGTYGTLNAPSFGTGGLDPAYCLNRKNKIIYVFKSDAAVGSTYVQRYNVTSDAYTEMGTFSELLGIAGLPLKRLAYNEKENYILGVSGGNLVKLYDGGTNLGTIVGTCGTAEIGLTIAFPVYAGTINNYFYLGKYRASGTYNVWAMLSKYDGTTITNIGTINGTANYIPANIIYTPLYYGEHGTIQEKVVMRTGHDLSASESMWSLRQYSSEYNLFIGTFNTSDGDYVADVLQELAEASNYVQYIDESGKYYFRRRDSGTTINHNFVEADISTASILEGDSVSESPIINKGVWGTNTGTVSYEDLPSQGTYGVQTYQLQNKWITTPSVANDQLYGMIQYFSLPKKILTANLRYYPTVKLFDIFTLVDDNLGLGTNDKWQVIGYNKDNANTEITGKEI